MNLEKAEKEKISEFMDFFLQNLPHRESMDIFLVLIGERPSCLVMDPDEGEEEKLREFCKEFDFKYQEQESRNESLLSSSGFFISRDGSRFKHLKDTEGRFYGFSDRYVGKFLGFPEDDIDFFAENVEDGPVEAETRKLVEELVSKGKLGPDDEKYVRLTTYVPRPQEENVRKAVETGKNFYDAILEFDRENEMNIGRKILEEFFGEPVF